MSDKRACAWYSRVEIRFAWWLEPYLHTLVFFCHLFGTLPDMAKLERVIRRAIRLRIHFKEPD